MWNVKVLICVIMELDIKSARCIIESNCYKVRRCYWSHNHITHLLSLITFDNFTIITFQFF